MHIEHLPTQPYPGRYYPYMSRGCTHPVSPGYELLRVGGSLEASYGHLHASLAFTIVVTASSMSGNIGEGHGLSSVPHYLSSLLLNISMYLYLLYQDIKYRLHLRFGWMPGIIGMIITHPFSYLGML